MLVEEAAPLKESEHTPLQRALEALPTRRLAALVQPFNARRLLEAVERLLDAVP